jgi:hypothetical protein
MALLHQLLNMKVDRRDARESFGSPSGAGPFDRHPFQGVFVKYRSIVLILFWQHDFRFLILFCCFLCQFL